MSRGPGSVQQWITTELEIFRGGRTIAEMAFEFCAENEIKKSLQRSARHSLTRALRALVESGSVKRLPAPRRNVFCLTNPPKPDDTERLRKLEIAYHESGHAVIARARQLPIGVVSVIQRRRGGAEGYVSAAPETHGVGVAYHYDRRHRRLVQTTNDPSLHWAGDKVPPRRERTQYEHESEVLMCIAGGMADAMHLSPKDPTAWKNWQSRASTADMRIARNHRTKITELETWECYEKQAHEMLLKFWPMVEAVANALMRHGFLDASEVDRICGRVVRRQHFKMGAVRPIR